MGRHNHQRNANQNTGNAKMTKQTIEVDVPKGWKAVAYRAPLIGDYYVRINGEVDKADHNFEYARLVVEKIQPRRMVLEETEEDNLHHGIENSWCNQHFCNGLILFQQPKRWREVKEPDLSLTNDEHKLEIYAEDAKELLNYLPNNTEFYAKLREFIGDK